MFAFVELRKLERQLRNRQVLSVFVDTSAADGSSVWRTALNRALVRLEETSRHLSRGERTALELCTAHLRTTLEGIRGTPACPAWVAYVTTDEVVAAGPVRARVQTRAFWQRGLVVRPLRAAPAQPVALALADVGPGGAADALDHSLGSGGSEMAPPTLTPSARRSYKPVTA